jgi:hypothetical protein
MNRPSLRKIERAVLATMFSAMRAGHRVTDIVSMLQRVQGAVRSSMIIERELRR